MISRSIKSILFDLGVVLLNLEYERAVVRLLPLCPNANISGAKGFFDLVSRDPSIVEYESGQISSETFFARFQEITHFEGGYEDFVDIWRDVFSENTPMINFARELAQTYDIYFFSNAGDLHVPYVYTAFPSLSFHKGDAVSCYLGVLKPDPEFYRLGLEKNDLNADECLFIDDLLINVDGAGRVGIKGVHYTTPEDTVRRVLNALTH
ncbi:MAG: HAD family phosphatase [Verrucomicrobia bacterium]|nr:HAD family phosphatase [Verrucomicrobiota bacterium]